MKYLFLSLSRIFHKAMGTRKNQPEQLHKNDFDLFKKKNTSKIEKVKEAAFEHCISCLVTWPVSVSTRMLDIIELSTVPNVSSIDITLLVVFLVFRLVSLEDINSTSDTSKNLKTI